MKNLIRMATFGLILSQWANTQSTPDYQYGAPLFRTDVGVVNVSVVALGRDGRPLPRLKKQNFKVKEKSKSEREFHEREISLDPPEQLPIRGGINIDTSSSTAGQFLYQLDVASEMVKLIIKEINNKERKDLFFVSEFYYEPLDQNPAGGVFTLKQDWTNDLNSLVKAIVRKTKKAGGGSPFFGNIDSAARKFRDGAGGNFANFLIMVADGQNNLPFSSLRQSAFLAQAVNLPIYTIGTANHQKIDPKQVSEFERNLKQISNLTSGRFFDLPSQNKLPNIARQILLDLRNQYHISYKLDPDYKDGDEIQVVVEVGNTDPNGKWQKMPARLLHRSGYRVITENPTP